MRTARLRAALVGPQTASGAGVGFRSDVAGAVAHGSGSVVRRGFGRAVLGPVLSAAFSTAIGAACRVACRTAFSVVVSSGALLTLTACPDPRPDGTAGETGKVIFQAPSELVFSTRIAVGSRFAATAVGSSDATVLGAGSVVRSSDEAVLGVTVDEDGAGDGGFAFNVEARAPGRAALVVEEDGVELDRIAVAAARAVDTTLVDGALLGATDAVDPRLPARFTVVDDDTIRVLVSATDRCGEALLDLGASSLTLARTDGAEVEPDTLGLVQDDGAAAFVVDPAPGVTDFLLELRTPDLEVLPWTVQVAPRSAIDEVKAVVASADAEAGSARLWGRAFVDDVEVVGQEFSWTSSERVTLDLTTGAAVTATIAFPEATAENPAPVDDRPATVTAEVVGEEATVDLFALQDSDLVAAREPPPSRATPPAVAEAPSGGASCGDGPGSTPCDPFAALLPVLGLRLRRRRRAPAR